MSSSFCSYSALLRGVVVLCGALVSGVAFGGSLVINELVTNHTGSDTSEYVEVFGAANTDFSAFTIVELEGDSGAPGTVDGAFPVGTTSATGHWSTGFLSNQLENGSITFLLVEGWSGSVGTDLDTNDDGVLDSTPWTALIDSVSISDGGASDQTYSSVVLAPNFDGSPFTPGGASRIPDGADTDAVSDWLRNDFDGAGIPALDPGSPDPGEALNTPDAPNQAVGLLLAPVINEVVANHTGSDTSEYIEVFGSPNADYSSFTIVELEGDGVAAGTVDGVFPVGTTNATGHWSTGFLNNQLENGSISLLLVEGWTGNVGDDLDTDNDGVLDVTPWTVQTDDVSISDGDAGDLAYSSVVLAPNFDGSPFTPGGVSRIPDGVNTASMSDWVRNDFDGAGIPALDPGSPDPGEALNTPDAPNDTVPQPAPELVINEVDYD
ncbi:MAG: hypothetical protein ACPGJE_03270, partial [Wenzhouxiangellaceae bacterium]